MYRLIPLLTLAATAVASPTQEILKLDSSSSQVIIDSKPLIDTEAIQALITAKGLKKRAEKLYEIAKLGEDEYNHPTRVIGSEGHLGTVEYIYATLAELGDYYELSNQTFPAVVGSVFEQKLLLGDKEPSSAQAMSLTPSTPGKQAVFGPLVLVANEGCEASDYPESVKGGIAFIKRGVCAFGDKSSAAGKAGAISAVIYNNVKGDFGGTLGAPNKNHIATFGISNEDAEPYIKTLEDGKVIESSAYIDSNVHETGTTNIIAQTKGGDQDNCVMLGGHSDSVDAGPGINDDGTGTLTLLEVATALTNFKVKNCVRFAWWAGEEEGLLGSDYYVSQLSVEENLKIRLFMDYDMLASPNYAYQVYNANNKANPVGSEELRDLYTDFYKSKGQNYTFIAFDGRSDYQAFIANGIPGGGIATGAEGVKTKEEVEMFGGDAGVWYDHCYHQLCDDLTNLNYEAWELNAKLVAHSTAVYALSFEGFPKRKSVEASAQFVPSKSQKRSSKFLVEESI